MRASKVFRRGTERAAAPTATVARIKPLMSAMGITRMADITGLDDIGIAVITVCRPNSRSLAVFSGKGLTRAAAQASGLMEAVETFHAEEPGLPLRRGRYADLLAEGVAVVAVEDLPRPINSSFTAELPILWSELREWGSEQPCWVPHELIHLDYTLPQPEGSGGFIATTNGLASGNCLSEAVSHGACEVIERDAVSLFRQRPAQDRAARGLALDSVSDPEARVLLDRLQALGLMVQVWDASSDLGIPVFLALLTDAGSDLPPELGAGCHFRPAVALLRSLTEAAQARTVVIAGSRDDIGAEHYSSTARDSRRRQAKQLAVAHDGQRDFSTITGFASECFEADLRWLMAQLVRSRVGPLLYGDLSRSGFGIPVVRVVIPGLEGPWVEGYQPGQRARRLTAVLS